MNPWVKTCEECGAEMLMALHERTRNRAPFDPGLVEGGNVEITRRKPTAGSGSVFGGFVLTYRIVPKAELAADPKRLRYQSHYVTCTKPERFRRG